MAVSYITEGDVEAKLLQPLFRDTLGYPDTDLEWKKPVTLTFGRERRTKEADLVVSYQRKPIIAVEAKRPTEPVQSGISQVDSYAYALETPYSIVTNGKQFVLRGYYSFNSKINIIDESVLDLSRSRWDKLANLISFKNISTSLLEKPNHAAAPNEEKIRDYRRFFRKIHNVIRDRDKLDPGASFDELSKLLFLKAAEDEWRISNRSKPVLTTEKILEWEQLGTASELVNQWFRIATTELFPGVFGDHPRIELTTGTLVEVLRLMQPFRVRNGDVDVKGRAFEEFLPSQLRGEGLGQYFTPRPVVNFMVELAGVSIHDIVVDFACGSGGFLIKAFDDIRSRIEELPEGTLKRLGLDRSQLLDDVRTQQIFGIDAEPRAARTAKMNMLMWGDGKRVVRGNALAQSDFLGNPYEPAEYDPANPTSTGCTLILANPPFGSKEKEEGILERYTLGTKSRARGSKSTAASSQKTEVLFLEKGIKLLRPGGRMLIVIPQGLLGGRSYAYVRNFIRGEAEIRAIVSLPTHTFVQSGVPTVNTCIVYIQKFTEEKKRLYQQTMEGLPEEEVGEALRTNPDFDYPIFMATAEFVGYEPSGRLIVGSGEQTDLDAILEDFSHQAVISNPDTDLFEFAEAHYGEKSGLRRDQTIRGTQRGLKTAFMVPFSQTEDRLDPSYYFFRHQVEGIIGLLEPLAGSIVKAGSKWRPESEDELDAEYPILTVSSDGKLTINELRRGEDIALPYRKVEAGDIVYNPMRINIGSIGAVSKDLAGGLVSPDYVVFRSRGLEPNFLVCLLRSPFYKMYIDVVATGSIRDRLLFEELQTIRVPDISAREQARIVRHLRNVDGEIAAMLREIAGVRSGTVARLHDIIKVREKAGTVP